MNKMEIGASPQVAAGQQQVGLPQQGKDVYSIKKNFYFWTVIYNVYFVLSYQVLQ